MKLIVFVCALAILLVVTGCSIPDLPGPIGIPGV